MLEAHCARNDDNNNNNNINNNNNNKWIHPRSVQGIFRITVEFGEASSEYSFSPSHEAVQSALQEHADKTAGMAAALPRIATSVSLPEQCAADGPPQPTSLAETVAASPRITACQ